MPWRPWFRRPWRFAESRIADPNHSKYYIYIGYIMLYNLKNIKNIYMGYMVLSCFVQKLLDMWWNYPPSYYGNDGHVICEWENGATM